MKHSSRVAGILAFSLFLSLSAVSQSATPAMSSSPARFDGAPFSSTAAELLGVSAAVPVNREFGAEIFLEEGSYRIAADGTLKYQHRLIFRVDSDDAVKGWAEASSTWDPWFENQSEIHARVLQPNGTFVELDQRTITDAPVKPDDDQTYSSQHVRRAPLPGMAIGSIVEEMTSVEEKLPYFAGGSLYRFVFRQNVPMSRTRLTVELPLAMPYKDSIHGLPGISVTKSEADGRRRIVYEATSLAARHESDIDLSTNTPTSPMVEFATGMSWSTIASGYAMLTDPQMLTEEAKAIVPKELPTARMAKIAAIVKQLHHEVRYTGVEFGAARLTPQKPSEVIQRHYGDCKDKATLLVAMLRSTGIHANLALLSTGPGRDVDAALPGMNQFNHAIVYVPAGGKGEDALWIDATAEYFAVGSLPFEDQGRNALVISPQTTALSRTPDPRPEDSTLVETRTFKLAGLGPSQVEEVSSTHGYVDASYRSSYGGPETPKIREDLERYVKNAYLAKKLTKLEHGDSADFDHPFNLKLVAEGARRGLTSLNDGAVAIFPSSTANSLPKWFSTEPKVSGPDTSEIEKHNLELSEKSRPESFTIRPYIYEQRVRILVPAGFTVRPLPENKTTKLGTATLEESYSAAEPGVVTVSFRFNSGPANLTVEQALAMRTEVLKLQKREYVGIFFDQSGVKALTAGHIREALEIDRNLIAAAPADALHHLHLANALLTAGIGSEAQAEVKKATELDPTQATAFSTYGWMLEHNALGERFGKGFDLTGAVSAYKRSIELDPDDNDHRFDLAILYEFNARGTRYAPDSDMASAIKEYNELIDLNKSRGDNAIAQYRENLLYVLLYSKQFSELDKLLATLTSTNAHRALAITSAAAQRGAAAGIAEADRGNAATTERNQNLRSAGRQLANLHRYDLAAEMMSAGIQGDDDAARTARQIELYKGLKTVSLAPLPASNPAAPVQLGLVGLMAGTITREQMLNTMSKHAYTSPESMGRAVDKVLVGVGYMRKLAEKSEMPESVLLDLIAGNTTFSSKGDDEKGWDVVAQAPGATPDHTYVVKEDGVYRVVAGDKNTFDDDIPVGNEVLWDLSQGKLVAAKALLDWKRDLMHKGSGDDPLVGALLTRFWTVGSSKPGADSPEAMRFAAISLLAGSMDAKLYFEEIAAARVKATGQRQTDLDLLLAVSAMYAEQPAMVMPAARRLLAEEPDSTRALDLLGSGYMYLNDAAGWQALLAPRLEKKPGDHDLLLAQVQAFEIAHDFVAAQAAMQKVLDSGKATAGDYNGYAWIGLFHNDFGEDIVKAAQQSAQMGNNRGFAELHTLACIYAAQGKTTEARQVLQEAMDAGSIVEPNSAIWYTLGLIYEQYGAKSAALDAFRHVQHHEFSDQTFIEPTSTYWLAQERIAALSK
jgi:tetratricopeptide (TPR) repeat protein